jgi:hypothetical protein
MLAPHLRQADMLEVSWEHRKLLHTKLSKADADLAESILSVLQVAGDAESLLYLTSFAGLGPYWYLAATGERKHLAQIAKHAADFLKARLDRQTAAETLLRPGSASDNNGLLRPAVCAKTPDSSTLLRADREPESSKQEAARATD